MKNKSTRHKEQNTFKFQPFSERIATVDVNIFHKVRHEYESQSDETESCFYQAIQKWDVLNLTEGYDNFKKEIRVENHITLPQILLSKDHIIEILLKHLRLKNPLCLQPLLELVVAVAQDLQKEFYKHYPEFLEVLISLLSTKDTDQLEWAFHCLAYLFKFLWRPLIKNINNVFNSLLPLLSDSRPEYINSFAAESFAFIARKVKDKEGFLEHLLKAVTNKKDGISGCGKLLFEVIHGVNGQFHSCAESFLPFYLQSLCNDLYSQETFFNIVEEIVSNIAIHIHPQKTDLLWESFIDILSKLLDDFLANKNRIIDNKIELIFKLMDQTIKFKDGKLLREPTKVLRLLVQFLSSPKWTDPVLLTIIQISITLLLSKSIQLPQEQVSQLLRKLLLLENDELFLYFVDNISMCTSFELLVLPNFLRKCAERELEKKFLYALTKLVLKKAPLCASGILLQKWVKYPLDFRESSEGIFDLFIKWLNTSNPMEDLETYFCSIVCVPHLILTSLQRNKILNCLEQTMQALLRTFVEDVVNIKVKLFILNLLVECALHLKGKPILKKHFIDLVDVLLKFSADINFVSALKTLSLLISVLGDDEEIATIDLLKKIDKQCALNFNSPYHEMRLFTSYIYTFFEQLPYFRIKHSSDPGIIPEKFKVFSLCHAVESIDPQVSTYREQLQLLEKLNFNKPQMIICNQTDFNLLPLRFLCGVLYMNFQLLWEPVSKIISSHAHGLNINHFWDVFGQELKNVVSTLRDGENVAISDIESEFETLKEIFQTAQQISTKPDFINYRLLLWKSLMLFPNVAEAKTRDVSGLLLDFVVSEYTKSNSELATYCSVKEYFKENDEHIEEAGENNPLEKSEGFNKKLYGKILKKPGRKVIIKVLLHKLAVFSQIKSPKSMYREPELYKLYFDLLKHKNADIQKVALDCIMTYRFKYLVPYKDNLYNLVDDKNFKHEITNFRIDQDSDKVLSEHREKLVPVILQIVFSKMSGKTGLRTGGKASGQLRRNLILRFLAGCQESEMLHFLEMSFNLYAKYLKENDEELVRSVAENIDLEKSLPPKKLLSTVNLLNVILDQFGGLMGDRLLTYLLKIVFVIGASIKGTYDHITDLHVGYLAIFRTLRTSCTKILESFFRHFDKYPWTNCQINAVFYTFVWPYLDKLNVEGIHSPTSMLKLFIQWGSNPKYFSLLVKYKQCDTSQYILPHIFNLLVNNKSHISVVNAIYEMIECMLRYVPNDEEQNRKITVDNELTIDTSILERVKVNEKLNYGSCILLPHIPLILQRVKRKLESGNRTLNNRELFILSRSSELVWESDISNKILQLLLPVVRKRCSADEDVLLQFLTSVFNLIQNIDAPETHLKQLVPMFGEVVQVSCRKMLIKILELITKKSQCERLSLVSNLVTELNAWDIKWVDQPDFERRHHAFKKIQEAVENNMIDVNVGTILIYNLFFMIRNEKDLALRDNSSHTLKSLSPYLIKKYQNSQKDIDYILNDCLFNLIRNGLRAQSTNDLRNESISLLGHLARECAESNFILRDLNKYTNKEDLEVDFFENLTHLQLHRHARALLKFCQVTKEDIVVVNPRTLTQFLLPLASHYLCSEKFVGKNSVIDAAIEMVGTICRILPWHQYEGVLKYSLSRLRYKVEYQKQLVKLVVVILDGFHFDLSKGHIEVGDNNLKGKSIQDIVPLDDMTNIMVSQEIGELLEETFKGDDEEGEGIEVEMEDKAQVLKVCEKITVLCKSNATRVLKTIKSVLLPQLHKSLAELTYYDSSHKVNRKRTSIEREEEDLIKVPISLAVVKLLQRLPKEILELNLPGVFMKICTFLKSQLESVRRVARETLQKVMLTLGPKYLKMLLSEMAPLLNRGFQVHVLVFTLHGILNCLKGFYEAGDIDEIVLTVLNLCMADLFGVLSEEKEIVKIMRKTSEAKSTKSFDTLQILGKYITEKCLLDVIKPIKDLLEINHSFKTVQKAQDALRNMALGLVDNQFISVESLLKFAYGVSAQKIPQLLPVSKNQLTQKLKVESGREDCFIIPKIPGNRTAFREANVKMSSDTNVHVMVEFGLRLCYVLLKREKLKDGEYLPFLDPFVLIFRDCLASKHVKLCTLTLQCLTWMLKYDIPSLKTHIKAITKNIFGILHKYASAGLSKGDNFDLVAAAFKAMAVIVRDIQYYTVDLTQLKTLIIYIEQDMHDHDKQATAFNLLKAIIARKLAIAEIQAVMGKVAELSITSDMNHVRVQARAVAFQFLMEYPLGNSLGGHLGFYMSQMSYEMQYGRESAIGMIQMLINSFPLVTLKKQSGSLFVSLGARLINDDVPECRKKVADCISSMLTRLPKVDRDSLFEITTVWLKDNNISHRRLAAQLCGIFVTVEKDSFSARLPSLTPLLMKQFGLTDTPGKFVKLKQDKDISEEEQRVKDHHHFQVLQLILKICAICPTFLKGKETVEKLAYHAQTLLAYPHDWVRLASAQFLGYVLSVLDVDQLGSLLLNNSSEECGYLFGDPENCIKSLTLDLCDQLRAKDVRSDLAEQVIKNLLTIAKVLAKVPINSDKKINLLWLSKLIRKVVNREVIENSSSIVLRTEVFKWIAGIGTALELVNIKPIMNHLLAPLVRELITTDEKNAPLRQLAKEVANHLKKRIGLEEYTTALQKLERNLSARRAERKRSRNQLAVTDPEVYAKKKIKRHEMKKTLKKRKMEQVKGKKNFKRRKVVDLEDSSEVM
ncbi:small subunit processome component 20 homolog [Cylas formicarius]|uniref:small subunit processome component 20 homolog n=1 Tax=Cylas formicarius TaxID=197179 RepID=UPI0029588899|nr:small subunit processome component 20 homolog [Cylas formicarius]